MVASLRQTFSWRAVLIAGLVAGTVFLLTNALLMPVVFQVDVPLLLRYMASLVLGSGAVVDPSISVLLVGLLVHSLLSLLFTLIIALVVHRWGLAVGVVGGALLGLALYGINLYAMTLIFDWFFTLNNPVLVLSHVVFGAVAGGVYEAFDHYDVPLGGQEVAR